MENRMEWDEMKRNMGKYARQLSALLLAGSLVFALAGCGGSGTDEGNTGNTAETDSAEGGTEEAAGSTEESTEGTEESTEGTDEAAGTDSGEGSDGGTVIQVVAPPNGFPLAYTDEDGNRTGYEIEIMRKVDELIPDYSFEFVEAEQDAAFTGLSTGKYQIAITNSFYTEERAENYNIPENPIGVSPCGLVVLKEDAEVTTLDQASERKMSPAPVMPGDGLAYQLELYLKDHPDAGFELTYSNDPNAFVDGLTFVAEGRYDFAFFPGNYYDELVVAEDGDLHSLDEVLSFKRTVPVDTYPIIAKGEDDLTQKVSDALKTLKDDGTMEKLSEEFYGFNVFDPTE